MTAFFGFQLCLVSEAHEVTLHTLHKSEDKHPPPMQCATPAQGYAPYTFTTPSCLWVRKNLLTSIMLTLPRVLMVLWHCHMYSTKNGRHFSPFCKKEQFSLYTLYSNKKKFAISYALEYARHYTFF